MAATVSATLIGAALSPVQGAWADGGSGSERKPAAAAGQLTTDQALTQARATGKSVPIPGATTPTSTLTALPNGRLSLTESFAPERKKVAGTWKNLDATLARNSDGTISPAVAIGALKLSGGGTGPFATMSTSGKSLSVSLPVSLPSPTLSGAIATYASVLPDVDLQVTAGEQGGFSEVLVVKTAAAAASPALKTLTLATKTTGLTVKADTGGNLKAVTPSGKEVFTAPAPTMWDSSTATTLAHTVNGKAVKRTVTAVTDPHTGQKVDSVSGTPLASTATEPGIGAHVARIDVKTGKSAITLTPNSSLLTGASTTYPVYVDPEWTPVPSKRQHYTYVAQAYPGTSYYDDASSLKVGYDDWTSSQNRIARSFVQESVPDTLYTAQAIDSSTIYFRNNWSPSCSDRSVELWWTGTISSSTTWNNQPDWTKKLASKSYAYGHSDDCPTSTVGYDITDLMTTAASGKWKNMTLGLQAGSESDDYAWKQFSTSITLTTVYDHTPNVPTTLTTSPATSCSATTPTTVGRGSVTLNAAVSDPDGGTLGVGFQLWKTSVPGTILVSSDSDSSGLKATSGTTAVKLAPQSTLDTAAGVTSTSPGAITEFSWHVHVSDFNRTSSWSKTCNLYYDPTSPGAPTITESATSYQVGSVASFTITANSTGTTPASYLYQLNGAAPISVTASSGTATISLKPTRHTNLLTVAAQSPGGNIGDTATLVINASAAATAADSDLTGDGVPDLVTRGGTSSIPAGLWMAKGSADTGNGQIITSAINLGANGNGITGDNSPTDFAGSNNIIGNFTGNGFQDVLSYYPSTSITNSTTVGAVLAGVGDGTPIQAQDSGNAIGVSNLADDYGYFPTLLANAYSALNDGTTRSYPDLIGISGNAADASSGTTDGYYLNYYEASTVIGAYDNKLQVTNPSPDGTMDWNSWTVTSADTTTGGVAFYLWNSSTGALYLWNGVTATDNGDDTATLAYTSYTIRSSGWNTGASFNNIRTADVNGDGIPDLWTVTTAGVVTSYLITGLSTTAGGTTVTAQTSQTLVTAAHTWPLNDNTVDSSGNPTAADTTGSTPINLTSNSGVTWNTGDLFDPDLSLDGSTSLLTTGGVSVINTASSFTVSVWLKPERLDGTVVSQDGTTSSGFLIYPATTGVWSFALSTKDASGWNYDTVRGSTVQLHAWTHITATYNSATGLMTLYVNGTQTGTATHTTTWKATGGFRVGDYLYSGSHISHFDGQASNIQTWNQPLTSTQVAALASS